MSLAKVIERSRKDREGWKYTDLEKLLSSSFRPSPQSGREPESRLFSSPMEKPNGIPAFAGMTELNNNGIQHRIVFVNGIWQPDLSHLDRLPNGVINFGSFDECNLILEGQTCLITAPIELLFLTNVDAPKEFATKLHIELGANGRLTLIERHEFSVAASHVIETNITLHPQAKLVHGKIVQGGSAVHLAQTSVQIAEGAYYDNFALLKGGRLVRNEIDARLTGKLAQCTLNGAILLRGREHADTTTRITHAAPHGTSRQVYKSVIADQARGVFQGKIVVEEGAQKTDGHQLSRALLLSDQAEMDAKPELQIYADDVKCSHGSTVGDLDEQALFYLRARGLDETEARALLIEGFIGEILDEIHVPEWRDTCRTEVEGWLHGK